MTALHSRRRRNIAVILYGVALFYLVASLAIYSASSHVSAIVYGVISSVGITLGATSILIGRSKDY